MDIENKQEEMEKQSGLTGGDSLGSPDMVNPFVIGGTDLAADEAEESEVNTDEQEGGTIWRVELKTGTIYYMVTDWKNIADVLLDEEEYIFGSLVSPINLTIDKETPVVGFNFITIKKSEIVSIAGVVLGDDYE